MKQLLLVLVGVALLVLIVFAPHSLSSDKNEEDEEIAEVSHEGHDHEIESAETNNTFEKESIEGALKENFATLEGKAEKIADVETQLSLYDSLIALAIQNNLPPRVALYSKKKAQAVPTENNWLLAGDNYFKAFRLSKNSSSPMIQGAIDAYEEVLKLNAENLKAKTAQGVAFVEGASVLGEMPMKGIGMLLEVVKTDPENIDALTNLGYFAIQSGQYEKAIGRFETILEIDPNNAEAYIYLTDIYLSQDNVEKGIETLETYKSLVEDPLVTEQVDAYIEELKNK